MRKKSKKYSLSPSLSVSREGEISIYKLLQSPDTFSAQLLEKNMSDIKELLNAKLENLVLQYKVPQKDIVRIKGLITEIEKVAELKC